MHSRLANLAMATLLVVSGGRGAAGDDAGHPFDPLSSLEYSAVISALKRAGNINDASRYPLITILEPDKGDVLQWKTGGRALPRRAFVIVKNGRQTFEAVVDLLTSRVTFWRPAGDIQPNVLQEEWTSAQELVRAHPGWQAAVRKRGIDEFDEVVCVPLTAGYFGIARERGRRLVKIVSFDSRGIGNFWGRPIEGLTAVVDLDTREVVSLIDTGAVPVPDGPVDLDEASVGVQRQPPNPISIVQSQGPTFTLQGQTVTWQKWSFHFRIHPRLGPVISLVRYDDNGRMRSILYQGFLSELFVPYMDPGEGWYFRTYLDAGEFGLGKLVAPLEPGLDCPPNAVFFNAVFADDRGIPYTRQRAACLFERYSGDVAWRHYESVNDHSEVRRRTELVLRFVSSVGNYDYIFDWVFRQDGSIKVAVGATGIEQVKAVRGRTIHDDPQSTTYGHMVAEHTVAINHDHYFCFRLDLDVDGRSNSFVIDRLKTVHLSDNGPRTSIWVVDSQTAASEQAARMRINLEKPALWRVINPNVIGPLGYPVSYQLKPRANAVSLLAPDDFPQRRAGFTDFHLWVTPYHPDEQYAAGTYPNQSRGGDGLPAWTSTDRPLDNTDVVLWYTVGFHHVVRAEDWPVMPTAWHEFELRPYDFFTRNPALDIPR